SGSSPRSIFLFLASLIMSSSDISAIKRYYAGCKAVVKLSGYIFIQPGTVCCLILRIKCLVIISCD
ncbi:MAG: hypothetical protein O7D98_07505, partial [Candidatus Dadabacteria bacterium]|nr:hypothetical protein [Candidatus Dadabacteria bacterium]